MCGIAGFVGHSATGVRERLERMSGALVHRGPDDGGLLVDRGSGLAMRRLSIVGIETGAQPILSEDATVAIVGNGEIYNAPELRAELEARGHRFRGGSDIEVALHLFEELGEELLGRLNGMFALAILERPSGRILVARDRLGIKPLFHATTAAGTLFASEIPALRRGLEPSESALLEADPLALRDFLSLGYVPSPRTMHRGIRRLPPGHRMWITPGGAEPDCWWNLPDFTPEERSVDGWAEEAAELIADAVRLRTMGDVPAGAFLSGGLDSGTVVGLLARQVGGPVPAFTLAFDDPRLDELEDARRTARHFGLEHHVETLSGVRFEEVEALLGSFGEPFADVSLLPTHRVSRLAAERVKFVISGDGGDELFGGYPWLHREARMRALPGAVLAASRCLGPLLRATQSSVGAGFLGKALRLAGDLASDSASAFIRRRSLCPPGRLRSLLHPRIRAEWRALPPSTLERHAARLSGEPLELLLDLDRRHSL
ncbi:MAG: asparagine synthase (glutamine-hydrolyzing), partial [Planctomycetota bacterium]